MRRFYQHEDGSHAETMYYLARDPVTGAAYVHHEWYDKANVGERRMEIVDFLTDRKSTAQSNLLKLIGTLAGDDNAQGS